MTGDIGLALCSSMSVGWTRPPSFCRASGDPHLRVLSRCGSGGSPGPPCHVLLTAWRSGVCVRIQRWAPERGGSRPCRPSPSRGAHQTRPGRPVFRHQRPGRRSSDCRGFKLRDGLLHGLDDHTCRPPAKGKDPTRRQEDAGPWQHCLLPWGDPNPLTVPGVLGVHFGRRGWHWAES